MRLARLTAPRPNRSVIVSSASSSAELRACSLSSRSASWVPLHPAAGTIEAAATPVSRALCPPESSNRTSRAQLVFGGLRDLRDGQKTSAVQKSFGLFAHSVQATDR